MMNRSVLIALSIPALAAGLSGCVVDEGFVDTADEPVEEAEFNLGELGCASVAASDTENQPGSGATISSTSTDGSYNIDATCPHQWVTEYAPKSGASYFFTHVYWADTTITSQTTCNNARLTLGVYRKPNIFFVWELDTTTTLFGTWNNGSCSFTGTTFTVDSSDKIRLAGAAFIDSGSVVTYKKVTVSLQAPI